MPEKKCSDRRCNEPARVGVRTTRPTRPDLRTTIYWDERVAPATASLYCKEHGKHVLAELANTLIDEG